MNRRRFLASSSIALGAAGVGAVWWPRRWSSIVIHHSAGAYGTIAFLQQVHRARQPNDPIDAIPYHYVIGNGSGLGVGVVSSDWRRDLNIWGAHVSANNPASNLFGLGVCLIGNLEERPAPPRQYQSLVELTRRLMSRYNITADSVTGHGMIEGELTKCPGRFFPMEEFKRAIT